MMDNTTASQSITRGKSSKLFNTANEPPVGVIAPKSGKICPMMIMTPIPLINPDTTG